MTKARLEAFSDGVIAILITIMVLEMKVPHGTSADISALRPVWPVFLSYVLSFVYLGIYWSNHHHLFQVVHRVNGAILWANLHLLFWLSLIPFVTHWMGENHFARLPSALYGAVLLCSAIAYYILAHVLLMNHGPDSVLARSMGHDLKGKISILVYIIGIMLALVFSSGWMANAMYVLGALMWLVPDLRIERTIAEEKPQKHESGEH